MPDVTQIAMRAARAVHSQELIAAVPERTLIVCSCGWITAHADPHDAHEAHVAHVEEYARSVDAAIMKGT